MSLRNALVPIVTVIGLTVALMIGGTVVTETVFNLPGVGNLVVRAVLRRDYPVIQGTLLVIAAIYVLINLSVDLLYTVVDPRIRLKTANEPFRMPRCGRLFARKIVLAAALVLLVSWWPRPSSSRWVSPRPTPTRPPIAAPARAVSAEHCRHRRTGARRHAAHRARRALLAGHRRHHGAGAVAAGTLLGMLAGFFRRLDGAADAAGRRDDVLPRHPAGHRAGGDPGARRCGT
jgi:hypothetical protein